MNLSRKGETMAIKQKIKLLIIDDEKDICEHEKNIFEKRNFEVYASQTGNTALDLAKTKKPDMALIDIHMAKGINGLEILGELLKIQPDCKCIIASWDKERALEAKKLGAVDIVVKPTKIEDLEKTVEKVAKKIIKSRSS